MSYSTKFIYGLLLLLPTVVNANSFIYDDVTYDPDVQSVFLKSASQEHSGNNTSPVLFLGQQSPMVLHFDIIYEEEVSNMQAKVIHCNADWTPSTLRDMEYLNEYNEFPVQDYVFSANTRVPYTHYTLPLPQTRISGNFLLLVYKNHDTNQPVLTRRFLVVDDQVGINAALVQSSGVRNRLSHHQIDLQIQYSRLPIPNPTMDVTVVIRQNNRWDNIIYDLKPTQVREEMSQMVYQHFGGESSFAAGNEFRFFDLRSILYSGQNIDRMHRGEYMHEAYLFVDRSRSAQVYSQYRDQNGAYIVQNRETSLHDTEADYVNVQFQLKTETQLSNPVYVAGALNNWQYNDDNKMEYDIATGLYQKTMLLKQGWYDYKYLVPDENDINILEGSFFETSNVYEIIVYVRDLKLRSDLVVGYTTLQSAP